MPADPNPIPSLDNARRSRARRSPTPEPEQVSVDADVIEFRRTTAHSTGRMWVGPTSDATRRLVAESRIRQGLPPRIDNPAVIESLALFLRNALDTLDRDRDRDRDHHRRAA
ncbi:hypothetical protein AB0E01_29360 [Nocardia vinacea]|uniref:hypothetical protein n=1 Tax=Nocardia vinacea TaxID=96468 RepID=UPI0033C555DA